MVKDAKIDSANLLAAGDGEKDEVGSQVKNVHKSTLSHGSTIQREHEVEIGDELQKGNVEVSEGEQIALADKNSISEDAVPSTQKHSIVLEVIF